MSNYDMYVYELNNSMIFPFTNVDSVDGLTSLIVDSSMRANTNKNKIKIINSSVNYLKNRINSINNNGNSDYVYVGIKNMLLTVESNVDGGENKWRITLDDDTYREFSVYNGAKGSTGDSGSGNANLDDYITILNVDNSYAKKNVYATKEYVDSNANISTVPSEDIDDLLSTSSVKMLQNSVVTTSIEAKQDTLESEHNIRTVNGNNVLGSGSLTISSTNDTYPEDANIILLKGTLQSKKILERFDEGEYGLIYYRGVVDSSSIIFKNSPLYTKEEFYEFFAKTPPVYILNDSSTFFYIRFMYTSSAAAHTSKTVCFSMYTLEEKDYFDDLMETYGDVYYGSDNNTINIKDEINCNLKPHSYYTLGSELKVFCEGLDGKKTFIKWNGTSFTINPSTNTTINYLNGTSISGTENCIYEIVGDVDLAGTTFTPAANSVIRYAGGRIMYGNINGSNNFYVDCPDNVKFFKNVRFSYMVSLQVWKDSWFEDIFDEGGFSELLCVSLSKDYIIKKTSMYINSTNRSHFTLVPYGKVVIYGNNHTLTIPAKLYVSIELPFLLTKYVEVHDLNIKMDNVEVNKTASIFDCNIGIFYNVKYEGIPRFVASYLGTAPTTSDMTEAKYRYWGVKEHLPLLLFYDCDFYVGAFMAEAEYNIVIMRNTKILRLNKFITYGLIMSVSPYGYNDNYVMNSYIDCYNCYIEGAWECPNHGRVKVENGVYKYYYSNNKNNTYYKRVTPFDKHVTFNRIRFEKCELYRFSFGYAGGLGSYVEQHHSGTTEKAEFIDCTLYVGPQVTNFFAEELIIKNCYINYMAFSSASLTLFLLNSIYNSIQFINNVFDNNSQTSRIGMEFLDTKNNGVIGGGITETLDSCYVLAIIKHFGENSKIILKDNKFIWSRGKTKVAIYCPSSNDDYANRIECSGNRFVKDLRRSGSKSAKKEHYLSNYGFIYDSSKFCTGGIPSFEKDLSTNLHILPIEGTTFRSFGFNEQFSNLNFDTCNHDFNFSTQNVSSNTTKDTSYFIYDSTNRRILKKTYSTDYTIPEIVDPDPVTPDPDTPDPDTSEPEVQEEETLNSGLFNEDTTWEYGVWQIQNIDGVQTALCTPNIDYTYFCTNFFKIPKTNYKITVKDLSTNGYRVGVRVYLCRSLYDPNAEPEDIEIIDGEDTGNENIEELMNTNIEDDAIKALYATRKAYGYINDTLDRYFYINDAINAMDTEAKYIAFGFWTNPWTSPSSGPITGSMRLNLRDKTYSDLITIEVDET